jgi:hypothetical protein
MTLNELSIVRGISSPAKCQQIIDKLAWCENNPVKRVTVSDDITYNPPRKKLVNR